MADNQRREGSAATGSARRRRDAKRALQARETGVEEDVPLQQSSQGADVPMADDRADADDERGSTSEREQVMPLPTEDEIDLSEEEPIAPPPRSTRVPLAGFPPDTSEMNVVDAAAAMQEYELHKGALKRTANRLSSKRSNQKRKLLLADADEANETLPRLPLLSSMDNIAGGATNFVSKNDEFPTKSILMRKLRVWAEYLSLTLDFPVNDSGRVIARVSSFHNLRKEDLYVEASFTISSACWVVRKVLCSGVRGVGPTSAVDGEDLNQWRKGHSATAYTDHDLAAHIQRNVQASPSVAKKDLVALFDGIVRYVQQVPDHRWTRVRHGALVMVYGDPDKNIMLLPALKSELEKCGHKFTFETCPGRPMEEAVVAVKKAEALRL